MAEPKGLRRVVVDRIIEGMREVGILIVAFTPLDAILAKDPSLNAALLRIFLIGAGLFTASLPLEWLASKVKEPKP